MRRVAVITVLTVVLALSITTAKADVVDAGNSFAMDLYGQLAEREDNLFFSPASIHTALGMTYAGARNQTARQMAATLHLKKSAGGVHEGFAALLSTLNSPPMLGNVEMVGNEFIRTSKPAYQLVVANALWGQQGYSWNKEFLDLTMDNYGAGLRDVDFAGETEASRKTINAWIEEQTREKTKDLIPVGALSSLTRLVLTNAIYFKANWADDFSKHATREKPFHISATREITTPLMFQTSHFRYMETEKFQVLEMPYKGRKLAMVVFLPKEVDGLGQFEKAMTAEMVDDWLTRLQTQEVAVTFPTFEFASDFSLAKNLKTMGMTDAFSPAADFYGMTSAEKVFLSEVIHKAFVAVDEDGTEAAAATAVPTCWEAMVRKPRPMIFKADHPFLFLIRHNSTGLILFIGRVMNPQ